MRKNALNSSQKKQYYLATAGRRISAKFCDAILLIGVNIGIFFLFTFSIVDWSTTFPIYNHIYFSLAFSGAIFLDMIIWFLYFCVLPFFWKGYTISYRIFKLKLHSLQKPKKIINYIKHELWIWAPMFITIFLIAIISFAFNNPIDFLLTILFANTRSVNQAVQIVAGLFDFLIILSSIFVIGIIINTFANSVGVSLIDNYANLRVVHLLPILDDAVYKPTNKKDLPGLIDLDELGNL